MAETASRLTAAILARDALHNSTLTVAVHVSMVSAPHAVRLRIRSELPSRR
jgi:hypothetical protein